jgi:DNA-binding IclR family transcriptional regulator
MSCKSKNDSSVRSVERALQILKNFTKKEYELSLGKLSENVGLPKSTVHRILQTMEAEGFIEQEPLDGRYRLGSAVIQLGDVAAEAYSDIRKFALPEMQWLSDVCEQTSNLYIARNGQRVCIGQVPGPRYISRYSQLGDMYPLYCGASGRVLLAFMEKTERQSYFDNDELSPITERTIVDIQTMKKDLLQVKSIG